MTKTTKLLFLLITSLAFLLRFWNLSHYPNSLNWDEISHGYNAYSLLQTGQDQWGTSWPIFNFRAYGDYPTTLNLYLTIPFISLLGLNPLSTRLPSAICGFLLVLTSYYLAKKVFKNQEYLSLFVMFLVAISPWTLFPSRAVFQSTVAQFFFVTGLTVFLYSLTKPKLLSVSAILFGLSQYAYHNTRLIVPLFVLTLIFIYYKKLSLKKILFPAFLFLLFTIPSLVNLLTSQSQARGVWVSIINPGSISYLEQQINNYQGNPIIGHLLYNKLTYFIPQFLSHYLDFLNPINLFFEGSQNYQFNLPHFGLIYPLFLPFYYFGIGYSLILAFKKDAHSQLFISWFLLGLIPAAITTGDLPIIRAFTIIPLPFIFITIGYQHLLSIFSSKPKIVITLFIIICSSLYLISYLNNYFGSYSTNYAHTWQYGNQQAVDYLKQNYSQYDRIYFTKKYGEPHQYLLYYWPWDPAKYQSDSAKKWDYHTYWYWVDAFDKFTFVNDWDIPSLNFPTSTRILLVTSPGNYDRLHSQLLDTIYYPNHQPVFDIVKINNDY